MDVKAIFVDWDGTLSNSRFWERWRESRTDGDKYLSVQKALFEDSQDLLKDWMCGRKAVENVVEYVASVTGIAYNELIDELRYSCENMTLIDKAVTESVQAIRRKGIRVAIASDNMDTFSRWTVPAMRLGETFDDLLVSVNSGALKAHISPDGTSPFFGHYWSTLGLEPRETVLIDNSLNNRVVESLGMKFMHVTDRNPLISHLALFI